jgi:hypothetical protein
MLTSQSLQRRDLFKWDEMADMVWLAFTQGYGDRRAADIDADDRTHEASLRHHHLVVAAEIQVKDDRVQLDGFRSARQQRAEASGSLGNAWASEEAVHRLRSQRDYPDQSLAIASNQSKLEICLSLLELAVLRLDNAQQLSQPMADVFQ